VSSGKKSSSKPNKQAVTGVDQGAQLERALTWIVNAGSFADTRLHGNVTWIPHHLVTLAVLFAWSDASKMTECFGKAAKLSQKLFGVLAVKTFQGMVRALVTYGPELITRLWARLQTLMEQTAPQYFRIGKWLPLAVDGSRFTTPRTKSNERAFAAKKYGSGKMAKSRAKWKNKKKRSRKLSSPVKPQIWLTLVWHMGLKLPWCWKSGPSNSSERDHLIELVKSQEFPKNTLFCGDAGFTGYEFWNAILEQGHHFLVRVGGNVRLLKNLAHTREGDGVVCLWPNAVARRNQMPIIVRLIEVKNELGSMYLVTSVLSTRQLSTSALKRLYPLRWGIELHFRAVKQTYGRGNLRSRNADHALVELEWSLVALTMIQLLGIREQHKIDIPPEQSSVAQALAAIRHAIDTWNEHVPRSSSMTIQLRDATKDEYIRTKSKTARYQPKLKDKPTNGGPELVNATLAQKKTYKALTNAA
jgi:hypothetical protein